MDDLNVKEPESQQLKIIDIFDPDEYDESLYVFLLCMKTASVWDFFKKENKIELRNATKHHLKIHVEYKTKDFAKEKDVRFV